MTGDSTFAPLNNPAWLRLEYVQKGRTLDDLAAEVGCHEVTVRAHLKRHGIRKYRLRNEPVDEAWLRREYVEHSRTLRDLAAEIGASVKVVRRARDGYGIPAQYRPPRRRFPHLHDGAWLRAQIGAGRTHREIAAEIGCTRHAVTMALRRLQ
jgi:DNA-binding CsgD family transcriptional regulator